MPEDNLRSDIDHQQVRKKQVFFSFGMCLTFYYCQYTTQLSGLDFAIPIISCRRHEEQCWKLIKILGSLLVHVKYMRMEWVVVLWDWCGQPSAIVNMRKSNCGRCKAPNSVFQPHVVAQLPFLKFKVITGKQREKRRLRLVGHEIHFWSSNVFQSCGFQNAIPFACRLSHGSRHTFKR